jgi:hypothetical protein
MLSKVDTFAGLAAWASDEETCISNERTCFSDASFSLAILSSS